MSDKPKRYDFLSRLYSSLREKLGAGDFLSVEDFASVFRSARGHAGGKAKAEAQALDKLLAAEGGSPTGCIVCLVPDDATAQALSVAGGLTPDQLHLTLVHFGDLETLGPVQRAEALLAVRDAAAQCLPLQGEISGIGRFTNGEQDVIYASLDAPALNDLREVFCISLEMCGFEISGDHGFTPHFTLTYLDREMVSPIEIVEPRAVRFESVQVWFGDEHITVPLLGTEPMGDGGEADAEGMPWEYLANEERSEEEVQESQAFAESGDLADLAAQGHTHRLFNRVAFAEAPTWIPYLPKPGSYAHPRYGTIIITTERNQRFVSNFQSAVYQDRLPIDAEHETKLSGAVGWITGMRLNQDGSADAKVDWTDRGRSFFAANRFRYFSPEWYDAWEDPATRTQHRDVAIGGALTTRPFFKDPALRPLFASEAGLDISTPDEPQSQGDDMGDQNTQSFAEMEARLNALEAENAALKQTSEAATSQSTQLAERLAAVEQARQQERFQALIKNDGARWFGEDAQHLDILGTLAQTYGEQSEKFAAYVAHQKGVAAMVRTSAAFQEIGGDGSSARAEDPSAKLSRLANERAEKQSISYSDALSLVASEHPDLYERSRSAAYVRTKEAE
jgi:2'-5' RNA ligase